MESKVPVRKPQLRAHSAARRCRKHTRLPKVELERLKLRRASSCSHIGARLAPMASKRNFLRTRLKQLARSCWAGVRTNEISLCFRSSCTPTVRRVTFHRGHVVGVRHQPRRKTSAGEVFCVHCVSVRACVYMCNAVGCDHGTDLRVHGRCSRSRPPSAGLAPWDSRGLAVLGCGGGEGRAPGVICTVQDAEGPSPAHRPSAAKAVADASGGVGAGEAGARSGAGQWCRELTPSGRPA